MKLKFISTKKIRLIATNSSEMAFASSNTSNRTSTPHGGQQKSTLKLHKIGRIGGGTYGRVYEARRTLNRPSSGIPPGVLTLIGPEINQYPGTRLFFPTPIFGYGNPPVPTPGLLTPVTYQENNTKLFAVKRNFVSPSLRESIGSIRELDLLNLVKDHPFCIKLEDVSFEIPFMEGALSPANQNYITDKVFFVLEKGSLDGEKYIHAELRKMPPSIKLMSQCFSIKPSLVNERKLFAVQILLAVEFLHSRGIYHRDIKPSNIICMVTPQGELESAKITDFGLAQYHSDQIMSSSGFVTLWYRAPEISLMKEYDFKVDVWSLGCILFELFSHNNCRFIESNTDETLINAIIERIPFSHDDYILAQQLYPKKITRSYNFSQNNLRSLREQLACTESQIAQFDSCQLGGKPNSGTFVDYTDLLSHMLVSDPSKRWNISQCLNHSFFDGFRELIDQMRTQFEIDTEGNWILKPDDTLIYLNNPVRSLGMKWFSIIYTNRLSAPISSWYSHRIFFHALEMFDRFNAILKPPNNTSEGNVVIWVNTFLFISAKYFRVLVPEFGIDMFATGIIPEEYHIFRTHSLQFEEKVIRDILKFEIYRTTIYEIANDFLTETSIVYLIRLILGAEIPPGTSLKAIWSTYSDLLTQINRTPSPTTYSNTPVVSLITAK